MAWCDLRVLDYCSIDASCGAGSTLDTPRAKF